MATRNYAAEYKAYGGKPEQIKNRAERNRARAIMEKKGLVKKGDGKDVGHIKAMAKGGITTPSNLRVETVHQNRSYPRTKTSGMK